MEGAPGSLDIPQRAMQGHPASKPRLPWSDDKPLISLVSQE